MKPGNRDAGFALVVVLWVGLLIAAIAGAFVVDTRLAAQLARNFVDNAEARALADGGVHIAMSRLLYPQEGSKWRRDGRFYPLSVPGGVLKIAVEDEAGKINLNTASMVLLETLFRSAGGSEREVETLLEAIEDIRRTPVSSGLNPIGRLARGSRSPKAFFPVDNLAQLPGISDTLFARLRNLVTVHGEAGKVNYLNARREVLLALPGVSPASVDAFLAERDGDDGKSALDEFVRQGQAREFWRKKEGEYVTLRVLAVMENGARFGRAAVVKIARGPNRPFLIREWREETIEEANP